MLAAGSLASSTTAFRVCVGQLSLLLERTPPLLGLGVRASVGGPEAARAGAEFRDDMLALARDSAEVSWRELRRGLDDFDAFSRPDEEPRAVPHRPYRAKT